MVYPFLLARVGIGIEGPVSDSERLDWWVMLTAEVSVGDRQVLDLITKV